MSWIESCESHLYTFTSMACGFLFYCKRLAFHLSAESQARYTDIACRVIKHVPLPCLKDHKFQLIEPRVSGSQVATEGWL